MALTPVRMAVATFVHAHVSVMGLLALAQKAGQVTAMMAALTLACVEVLVRAHISEMEVLALAQKAGQVAAVMAILALAQVAAVRRLALTLVQMAAMEMLALVQMAAVMAALALAQVAAMWHLACVLRRVQRRVVASALGAAATAALAAEVMPSAATVSWSRKWTMASLRRELLGCCKWATRSTASSSARASAMQES